MTIDIVTLFPEMFENFLNTSIIKRAITKELVKINIHNIRDYSNYKNKQVDEYPYGGGAGMVLMCEPVFNAVEALKKENTKVIMTTPSGITYNQDTAINLSKETHLIILCGHYEGFDERIRTICDYEISIDWIRPHCASVVGSHRTGFSFRTGSNMGKAAQQGKIGKSG